MKSQDGASYDATTDTAVHCDDSDTNIAASSSPSTKDSDERAAAALASALNLQTRTVELKDGVSDWEELLL